MCLGGTGQRVGCGGAAKGERGRGGGVTARAGFSLLHPFLDHSVKVMQHIRRKEACPLYHFGSLWRCAYLPEGVIQWIHPPTPIKAPGQTRPTSPLRPPGEERQSEDRAHPKILKLWGFHISFIPSLCRVFISLLQTITAG